MSGSPASIAISGKPRISRISLAAWGRWRRNRRGMSPTDLAHMRAALALARRGLGTTWPNPSVGCVIVHDGRVVGRGTTQPGGRPHAEAIALTMAGEQAKGAAAYVTLEPCCHWGRS